MKTCHSCKEEMSEYIKIVLFENVEYNPIHTSETYYFCCVTHAITFLENNRDQIGDGLEL